MADQVRYRYQTAVTGGVAQAVGPGERIAPLSGRVEPMTQPLRPTQMTTFRHPTTGSNVTVPLRLPDATPRMVYRTDRVIYDYGTYTVEARFLVDGSVEVIYNAGLLRPVSFE